MFDKENERKKLKELLDQSVKLWNAGKYDELANSFDSDITMKKLDDAGSVSGIGNVLVYLNKNQKSKRPQFDHVKQESAFIWYWGTLAQISGTATYTDREPKVGEQRTKENDPVQVRFTFTFCRDRDEVNCDWLLVNAFQAVVPSDLSD